MIFPFSTTSMIPFELTLATDADPGVIIKGSAVVMAGIVEATASSTAMSSLIFSSSPAGLLANY